jgi:hypothetical protein
MFIDIVAACVSDSYEPNDELGMAAFITLPSLGESLNLFGSLCFDIDFYLFEVFFLLLIEFIDC